MVRRGSLPFPVVLSCVIMILAAVAFLAGLAGCGKPAAPVDEHTRYVCTIAHNAHEAGIIDETGTTNAIVVNGRESPVLAVYTATQAYKEDLPAGTAPRAKASAERYEKLIKACENAGWSA
jgi:hypothetical protein